MCCTDVDLKTHTSAPVDGSRAEVSEQLFHLVFPESSSHPKVMFPKSLLITSSRSNITSVTAYLTVLQHHQARDCTGCTPGLIGGGGGRSGEWSVHDAGGVLLETRSQPFPSVCAALSSVSLNPVVSVSILLFCDDEQLQIRGPIQISLPLKPGLRLRAADTVPAWAFNFNMGENTNARGFSYITDGNASTRLPERLLKLLFNWETPVVPLPPRHRPSVDTPGSQLKCPVALIRFNMNR